MDQWSKWIKISEMEGSGNSVIILSFERGRVHIVERYLKKKKNSFLTKGSNIDTINLDGEINIYFVIVIK